MRTLYDVLGVDRYASFSEIEQSYRLNLKEHLDASCDAPVHKKDQRRMQQMRQAYLLLSSPSRRLDYDLQLDRIEQARLRRAELAGTVIGAVILIAGLVLIVHGYHRLQQPAPHAPVRMADVAQNSESAAALTLEHATVVQQEVKHAD